MITVYPLETFGKEEFRTYVNKGKVSFNIFVADTKIVLFPGTQVKISKKEIIVMPYKSKAQEKYFNANREKLEKQGVNVEEYNKASKGKKLPNRVKKKKK